MRHALVFNIISLITFVLAVIFLATKGLHLGVEFTGGTVMEINYGHAVEVDKIRETLIRVNLADATVQSFGSSQTALIRLPAKQGVTGAQLSETVIKALRQDDPSVELRRVDFVGSQVGKELVENGALALLLVSIGIVVYLALRFEWIRENFRKMRKASTPEVINNAITRTMSRTIITHGCTQLMVTSILIFGGETLHYFALALTIGILFGIYSSVLVASPLVMWLGVTREDFIKPEKKQEEAVV